MLLWVGFADDYGDYGDSWDFLFGLCQQAVFRWGLWVDHPFGMWERADSVPGFYNEKHETTRAESSLRSLLF